MLDETTRTGLAAVLAWYRAMGVDAVVADEGVDWLARGDVAPGDGFALDGAGSLGEPGPTAATPDLPAARAPAAAPRAPGASAPAPGPRPAPARPADRAEQDARTVARTAGSLEALEAALASFEGCGLKATAKNLCFYRGAKQARVMLIGEAPGRDEDIEGKPFVGRAGQLLDKMLAAIGLGEADVHITNIVYWRPPGNRTPTPQEALACRPFLERQIELVTPEVVVLLGGAAAKHILDVAEGIMRIRGKWHDIDIAGRPVKAIATLHPAYLLRTPAAKRQAWRDLLAIASALEGPR